MIYGANGYTGRPIAEHGVTRGDDPILARRNREVLAPMAHSLGCELRVFELDDAREIERAPHDVAAVLHCAGPYRDIATPLVPACLATRTHDLDLTGEVDVLEEIARLHEHAQSWGVVLLPPVACEAQERHQLVACSDSSRRFTHSPIDGARASAATLPFIE